MDMTQTAPPRRRPVKPVWLESGDVLKLVKVKNRRLYSPTLHKFTGLKEVGEHWDRGVIIFATSQLQPDIDITAHILLDVLRQRVTLGELEIQPDRLRTLVTPVAESDEQDATLLFLQDAYKRSMELTWVLRAQLQEAKDRLSQWKIALAVTTAHDVTSAGDG